MSQPTLEERVAALEKQVAQLLANAAALPPYKDWRRVAGRFSGDEVMKQIDEEGRKIREADRERARRRQAKSRKAKS
jgi:hypothetical protein